MICSTLIIVYGLHISYTSKANSVDPTEPFSLASAARLRTNPASLSGQGDQKPETASPGWEANVTPSSDPASGLGEGKGGQTAVVSAPGQPDRQPFLAPKIRLGENLSHVLASPTFVHSLHPRCYGRADRQPSRCRRPHDSQGEPLVPPEPPAITTLLRPGLRDRARPSSSLAYFSCPLSLTVSSKRHRQRVRVCLGTAGGYLLHCQHTSKARGRPLLLHGKEGY